VKVEDKEGKMTEYATSGGFVEVKANKVVMLAEAAELPSEIDIRRAQSAKERAQQRLADRKADVDLERARAALARALNRLKLAGNP
jgi:F-type H+-transporting ATPase subunit epsilon